MHPLRHFVHPILKMLHPLLGVAEHPIAKYNPNHEPAGSPTGGRFARGTRGGGSPPAANAHAVQAHRDALVALAEHPRHLAPTALNRPLPHENALYRYHSAEQSRSDYRAVRDAMYPAGLDGRDQGFNRSGIPLVKKRGPVIAAIKKYIDGPAKTSEKQYDIIDRAIDQSPGLPRDVVMYRGMQVPRGFVGKGLSYVHTNVVSTSNDAGIAIGFADGTHHAIRKGKVGILVRFIAPRGTKALPMNSGEREFLLPRGAEFTLVRKIGRRTAITGWRSEEPTTMEIWTATLSRRTGVKRVLHAKRRLRVKKVEPDAPLMGDPMRWLTTEDDILPPTRSPHLADATERAHTSLAGALGVRRNRLSSRIVE